MLKRAEQYSSGHKNKISFENHITTTEIDIDTECDIEIKEEILDSDDEEKFVIKTEKEDSSDESETNAYVTLLFDDFNSKKLAIKEEIDEDTKYDASSEIKLENKFFKSDEKFLKHEEKFLRDEKKLLVSHNNFDEIQEEELIIKDEPIEIDDDNDIRDESFFLDFVDNDSNDVIDDEETETADEDTDEIDVVSIDDDFRPSWWNTVQQTYQSKPPPVKRIKTLLPRRQPSTCNCKTKLNTPNTKKKRRQRQNGRHENQCPLFNRRSHSQSTVCPERRIYHIQSERQRRIELKSSIQELRDLIPEVKDKKKVSKVLILSEASAYVQQLKNEHQEHQKQVNELLLRQRDLLSQLPVKMNIHDVFSEKSTQRHDYTVQKLEEPKRYHQWNTEPKTPEKKYRQKPYQPKDIQTMRPWAYPYNNVPFSLLFQKKDVIQTHPQATFTKCTKPDDPLREEAMKTRPRLYISPAVSMDDISDKEIRHLLTNYMYSTVFEQATAECNLKFTEREVPNTAFEKCVDPAKGSFTSFKPVPPECRKIGKSWEAKQYTNLVDPDRKYWLNYKHRYNTIAGKYPYAQIVSDETRKEIRDLVEKDELRQAYDLVKPCYTGYVPKNVVGPFRKQELSKK